MCANWGQGLTSDVVAEDPGSDDSTVGAEEVLEILLSHVLWQATNV